MKPTTLAALLLGLLGSGCGNVLDDILPSKGSCTVPSPRSCTDYTGGAWSTPSSGSRACAAVGSGATYSSAACATSGRVGSCVVNSGETSEIVLRFYPPSTAATAQAACGAQAGSRFVAN
jgi:uncharacterized protein YceK